MDLFQPRARPEFNETGLGQNKNLSNLHFALFSEDLFFRPLCPRQGSFWTNDFHFALVATLLRDKAHFGQIISILHWLLHCYETRLILDWSLRIYFSGPGPGQNNNLSNFHFALVSGLFIPAPGPARVQSFNFIVFPIGADGSLRTVLVYLMVIHYMDNRGNSTLPKKMRF